MKKLLVSLFSSVGLEIRRKKRPQPKVSAMTAGFHRFSHLGLPIETIIDVGAAAGTWSLEALRVWPNASYVLLEPLLERRPVLESLTQQHKNFSFLPFAAGNKKTSVNFVIADDLDGSGIASSDTDLSLIRSVEVIRLDEVVRDKNLKGPFVIKLDTHGFEVPILEGCTGILNGVSLFIIECYGFQIADNSLLFWEMSHYMEKLGFRLFDVVNILNRPKDGAFWQCDAFFIKKDNSLFSYNHYR